MKYIFSILLLPNLIFGYNNELVKTSLNLSQSAYCVDNIDKWNCETCDKTNKIHYIIEKRGTRVLIGYNKKYNSYFVSFRGSSNIQNWINNMHVRKIYPYDNLPDIGVDKGFYEQMMYNYKLILNCLNELSKQYDTKKIILTGHSSGAATSTLMAFNLEIDYYKHQYEMYSLITFGSPRIGNLEFVNLFKNYNFISYRITHYNDIVPHLPLESLGYNHIPQEVWYNEDNTKYKICNDYYIEDDECSNSCYPLNCDSISDHKYYLNITFGIEGSC